MSSGNINFVTITTVNVSVAMLLLTIIGKWIHQSA